ncbi:hypothetical protein ABK040_011635 [Willaertia magna]
MIPQTTNANTNNDEEIFIIPESDAIEITPIQNMTHQHPFIEENNLNNNNLKINNLNNAHHHNNNLLDIMQEEEETTIMIDNKISELTNVPEYEINLDLPPKDRWYQVIQDYKSKFPKLIEFLDSEISSLLGGGLKAKFAKGFLNMLFSIFVKSGAVYYKEELEAIANQANVPLGLFSLIQLSYELFACCTSIIKQDYNNVPIHVRSMDWEMPILREYTVQLNFTRNGKTVFKASSWAGYVGILTGCRVGAFSVSINFRRTEDGTFGKNVLKSITSGWPISFLVREVLQDCTSYEEACAVLQNSKLIAPVYITVAGCHEGQGKIITRNRETYSYENTLSLNTVLYLDKTVNNYVYDASNYALIQTNVDWWLEDKEKKKCNILYSRERLKKAQSLMEEIHNCSIKGNLNDNSGSDNNDSNTLFNLINIFDTNNYPILNETTIYTTAMKPSTGEYATIIVDYEQQRKHKRFR